MAKKVRAPEEGSGGAPKWMVTFSDCMTLLLTFFVLLLSFSSFDDKSFMKATTSLARGFPSVNPTRSRDSLTSREQVLYQKDRSRGSENPTENPQVDGFIQERAQALNFQDRRVFVIPSDQVFLGRGSYLSPQGRTLMGKLARFLKAMPQRIVISENSLSESTPATALGLQRAWRITNHLINQADLDLNRFAISGTSTVPSDNLSDQLRQAASGRLLEIVLLDDNICQ